MEPEPGFPSQDIVVFEHVQGGRAIRVRTAYRDFACIVNFHQHDQLHCNVYPAVAAGTAGRPNREEAPRVPEGELLGRLLVRFVPILNKGVFKFVEMLLEPQPQEEAQTAWDEYCEGVEAMMGETGTPTLAQKEEYTRVQQGVQAARAARAARTEQHRYDRTGMTHGRVPR